MPKSSSAKSTGLSRRVHFTDDEQRLTWLSALLDCYAIADTGVAIAIRDIEKKQKKKLACRAGCDVCCLQPDIPFYPHELQGLAWYVAEKLDAATREQVVRQCSEHAKGSACPFLADHGCAVHAVRPVACRQYNVFTAPCAQGEDPYYSRRQDVLVPISDYTDRAFAAVRAFYGLEKEKDLEKAVRQIKAKIMNLQEYDWKGLARLLTGTGNTGK